MTRLAFLSFSPVCQSLVAFSRERSWQTLMRESRVDGASNKARKGELLGDTNNHNNANASAPEDVRPVSNYLP